MHEHRIDIGWIVGGTFPLAMSGFAVWAGEVFRASLLAFVSVLAAAAGALVQERVREYLKRHPLDKAERKAFDAGMKQLEIENAYLRNQLKEINHRHRTD